MVKLPTWATTVTPFSKYLALAMLVVLPILAFFYGMYYQKQIDVSHQPETGTIIIVKPTPLASPAISQTISPSIPQPSSQPITSQPITSPPNGRITCTTSADCPADYFCAQPGPIIAGRQLHRSCWRKGSVMPL